MAKPEPMEIAQVAAMGVAAMAVAVEMLLQFEKKGLITDDEGVNIIDAALAGLERMGETHRSFRMARTLLDGQLAGWQRHRPK
jgi:hypothetical protein